jgi:hypothetical protein
MSYRDIYQEGDDITYVCRARFALKSARLILKAIADGVADLDASGDLQVLRQVSASAGIAYVKPHFPFNRAYDIAEQCCRDAKDIGKEEHKNSINIGYWLDYRVIRGSGTENSSYVQTMRPYCLAGPAGDHALDYDIRVFDATVKVLKDKLFARSSLKAMRDSFIQGGLSSVLGNLASKGQKVEGFYSFDGKCHSDSAEADFYLNEEGELHDTEPNSYKRKPSPVFDALDLMDLEVQL